MANGNSRARLSSFDLAVLGRDIAKQHNCFVRWELHLPVRKDSGISLTVRAVAYRSSARPGDGVYERGISGAYPGSGGRTLVGELYRVTWDLLKKLDDEAAPPGPGTDRLPGF